MKKLTSLVLAAAMLLCLSAASAENLKHERVFAVLGPDGKTENLTDSVRLENRDGMDELPDSTLLSGIQNTGGHESFTLDGTDLVWQAGGKDITYQGTSDKALPVKPVVSLALDGAEISAKDLAGRSGRVEITVRYEQPQPVPHLALTLLLLPESGVSAVETENAELISFSGRRAVVGWAVPGADPGAKLPASFTVRFDADHVNLGWMMTFASADPVDAACREISSRLPAGMDLNRTLEDIISILSAMQAGNALPETSSPVVNVVTGQINDLNDGLAALSGNSASLNDGADALFDALLDAAGQQLASAMGPSGKAVPALTAENYSSVLNEIIAELDPDKAQDRSVSETLRDLLARLDQAGEYVSSVKSYTAGVDQISVRIRTAEKLAASALINIADTDLRRVVSIFETTRISAAGSGYDLRPEGMKTVTVYIVRSDLQ